MVELKPIENSSQIDASGYDAAQRVLAVRFKGGSTIYHFRDVDPDVAAGLPDADSPGRYLQANIKGVYEFEKIEPQEDGE